MSAGYLLYLVLVVLVFSFWFAVFCLMRKLGHKTAARNDVIGFLLAGPFHFHLKKREYKLSTRELLGWLGVAALLVAAPLVTRFLEG